ncbi:hypothetical protein HBP99_16040 [Listeria booriae]|uniref:hypothetical protein n=1 Tax=Listeria booriae TaxID=1552123 RepID=UPI001625ADA9|nr:hypothetical protein [Listeria booriae]MBC2370141.1 hypothetical protein [Listeria booriae]
MNERQLAYFLWDGVIKMRPLGLSLSDWVALATLIGIVFAVLKRFLVAPLTISIDQLTNKLTEFMTESKTDRTELRNQHNEHETRLRLLEIKVEKLEKDDSK